MAQKKAEQLPVLASTLIGFAAKASRALTLELDELWSFVLKKVKKRWIWLALCRQTRQVVAYAVGDRSEATARQLWSRIPAPYRSVQCYSDFWDAYALVLPAAQHSAVGKETGETAHIERFNNTLRQRLGRPVRKTLSFSRSDVMHELCLKLFLHRYNSDIQQRWNST